MADLFVPVSVNMPEDPKILAAGDRGELVFVRSLCLCKRHQSDGFVARPQLRVLGATEEDAALLVGAGLWVDADGGWRIAAWLNHNPPRAELDRKRAAENERKAEWRRNRDASRDTGRDERETRDTEVASARAQEPEREQESESEVNATADQRVARSLSEELSNRRWHPRVTEAEVDDCVTTLRSDGIPDATIIKALSAKDDLPRKMADRARDMHRPRSSGPEATDCTSLPQSHRPLEFCGECNELVFDCTCVALESANTTA